MIEFLNARRMIFIIGLLIILCIIIVILEDTIADNVDKPTPYMEHVRQKLNLSGSPQSLEPHHESALKKLDSPCWQHESFTILSRCSPCGAKERQLPACIPTGFKEHLQCQHSGQIFRSCDSFSSLFWVFEFFMFSISSVFIFYVNKRQSYLNKVILNRIEKQIACGV